MYIATVMLRRTEAEFWRMTPRKLNALTRAHIALNPTEDEDSSEDKPGYIDHIF